VPVLPPELTSYRQQAPIKTSEWASRHCVASVSLPATRKRKFLRSRYETAWRIFVNVPRGELQGAAGMALRK
jgi:hypothetical protein